MNLRSLLTLSALSALAAPALAASPVTNIVMSAQKEGAAQQAFTTDAPAFYLRCRIAGTKGTPVRADWIAVKVDKSANVAPNFRIDSAEVKLPVTSKGIIYNTLNFQLTRGQNAWPKGQYRVDIYIAKNGAFPSKPATSVPFEVK